MTQLTQLNQVAIAEICIYTPSLVIAILLSHRHGFGRNAGWLYLILFSLIRILGSALSLATIADPRNTGLLTGAATLQTVGLSPLILVALALLNRVLESIRHARTPLLQPRLLRVVQTVVLVGLILGIVGGVKLGTELGNAAASAGPFVYPAVPTESRVGMGLMIAGFGLLVAATALLAPQVGSAAEGEKRLLGAVAAALPFVLVRLVYSAIATFDTGNLNFRQFGGSAEYPHYLIGMSVVMEMVAVAIIEGVGLTLRRIPKGERAAFSEAIPMRRYGGGRRNRHMGTQGQEQGISRV